MPRLTLSAISTALTFGLTLLSPLRPAADPAWPGDLTLAEDSNGTAITASWTPHDAPLPATLQVYSHGQWLRDAADVTLTQGSVQVTQDALKLWNRYFYELRLTNPANLNQFAETFIFDLSDNFSSPGGYLMSYQGDMEAMIGEKVYATWDASKLDGKTVKVSLYQGTTFIKNIARSVPAEQGSYTWIADAPAGDYSIRYKCNEDSSFIGVTGRLRITAPNNSVGDWAQYE